MAGFSGDGDIRILNSMRYNSNFNSPVDENQWFGNRDSSICFLQDIVHIGTKLRNRLSNSAIFLLIGNKIVSVAHLKILINSVPKAVHQLVYSDVCPEDRQNYDSLNRIMHTRVREALSTYVWGSEGTIEFICICDDITSSLYDENLSPLERLLRIWRSTFFIRAWWLHIKRATWTGINLDDNFISRNAHQCIELNAKNLLILVKFFRNNGFSKFFLPTIFNSQPCEQTFRKLRSMGTINFTKINFTLLELIHLIGRVELMNDIMYFKLADEEVFFPRNPIHKSDLNHFELPTDNEIDNTIEQALNSAVENAKKYGMLITRKDIETCKLRHVDISLKIADQGLDITHIDLGIASSNDESHLLKNYHLKDYSNLDTEESNSYVKVAGSHGDKSVRKSTLIWSLSNSREKISSDRLRRVQYKKKTSSRQLEFVDVSTSGQLILKNDEIKIGSWCIFENIAETKDDNSEKFLVGNIISFRYVNAKTKKEKKYSWDFAPIFHEENSRGVEVLAAWHKIDKNGSFHHVTCSFIDIKNYISHVSSEAIEKHANGNICLSKNCLSSIQDVLQSNICSMINKT